MTLLLFRAVFFASPTHSNGVDVVEEKGVFPPLSAWSFLTRFDHWVFYTNLNFYRLKYFFHKILLALQTLLRSLVLYDFEPRVARGSPVLMSLEKSG